MSDFEPKQLVNQELREDFKNFMESGPAVPSPSLGESLTARIKSDLEPSLSRVLAKFSVIYVLVSIVSLSICSQFGVRFFGEGPGLMNYFMVFGHSICFMLCGVLFLGAPVLMAGWLFSRAEWRVFWKSHVALLSALTLASLGILSMLDAVIFPMLALTWIAGALIGSSLFAFAITKIRTPYILQRA
jgi:hypothetical protein